MLTVQCRVEFDNDSIALKVHRIGFEIWMLFVRFHGLANGRGSFIDGVSPSTSLASGMDDLSFIKMGSLEGSRPDSQQAGKAQR